MVLNVIDYSRKMKFAQLKLPINQRSTTLRKKSQSFDCELQKPQHWMNEETTNLNKVLHL